jgi:hypothetical protein
MRSQRTTYLRLFGLSLVYALLASGAGNAATEASKAVFELEVPAAQLDDLRRFVHDLSVKWNLRNDDASYRFPAGHGYQINTLMQRPDGLKARFLGGITVVASSPLVRLYITCDPPCQDWKAFAQALESEVSQHWKTSVYHDTSPATPNNRSSGP